MRKKLQISLSNGLLSRLFVFALLLTSSLSFAQPVPPPPSGVFQVQINSASTPVICPNSSGTLTVIKTVGLGQDLNIYDFEIELQRNGLPAVSVYTGTTSANLISFSVTDSGSYVAYAYPPVGPNNMGSITTFETSAPAYLAHQVAPTISAGRNSTNLCPGGSVVLTSSQSGNWTYTSTAGNVGVNVPQLSVTYSNLFSTSQTYYQTNNCSQTSNSIIVTKNIVSPAISGTSTICAGGSTTLTASGGTSYFWSTSPNPQTTAAITVSPTTSTTYTVIATANGCSASTSQLVTVNNCNTAGPQGSFPANQCGYINNVPSGSMNCSPTSGANGYLVKFYNVGSSTIYAQKTSATTAITFTGLTPALLGGTQYDVTVTPIMPTGPAGVESNKCRMGLIATQTPSTIATTILQTGGCTLNPNIAPTFALTASIRATSVAQANTYQFQFTNVTIPSIPAISRFQTTARTLFLGAVVGLIPGATYEVRIRATVAGVQALNYGPPCLIKIAGSLPTKFAANNTTSDVVINNFSVSTFPNPFKNNTTFNISSENDEMINIQLIDIAGKIVFTERVKSNTNFEYSDDKLNSGIYFLQATKVDGSRKVIKVIKN